MIAIALVLTLATQILAQDTTQTIPLEYDISIIPELSALTFTAVTTVSVLVQQPTTSLSLNAKNLQIGENGVRIIDSSSSEEITGVTRTLDAEAETVTVSFPSLPPGLYDVVFTYSGVINEEQEGLYSSKYNKVVDGNVQERQILLTNFHYTKARQVFPCFDHPSLPATFTLSVVRPKDYISVSNMAKASEVEYDANRMKDVFAKSDTMPTFLVGFAVIDFSTSERDDFTVYSNGQEGIEDLLQWSENVIGKLKEIGSFGLTKIHQIVVPDGSLSKDALVNLGLIIYRESAVLYNVQRESHEDRQTISKVIAHAISTQWSKKADHSKWWPSYWTSEGITISYQLDILTKIEPSWRLTEQFMIQELANTLEYDIAPTAISLYLSNQDTPDKLSKYHYRKSFAFVRMFSHLPLPGDILENSENPTAVSWTQKTGYPILRTTRNVANNVITFTQDNLNLRPIPISVAFEDQIDVTPDEFNLILETNTVEQNFSSNLDASWYIVNGNRLGYFRTRYDDGNWRAITNFLLNAQSDINKISALDRALLIDDAFNLAKTGQLSYTFYLRLTTYMTERERDFVPIYAFIKTATELKALLAKTDVQAMFMNYSRNLLDYMYDELGTTIAESDTPLDKLSRIEVLTFLCSFGSERCQQEMNEIWSTTPERVVPDLQEPVFCGVVRVGDSTSFYTILDQYNLHKKKRVLKSLACTSDVELLREYVLGVVNESLVIHIDAKDKLDAFFAILDGSDAGVDIALDVVKQFLEQILQRFTEEDISAIFIALSKKLVRDQDQIKIDEIIACLDETQKVTYGTLFENVKENIRRNIEWQTAYVELIWTWLENRDIPPTTTTIVTETPTPTPTPKPGGAAVFTISLFTLFASTLMYLTMH